MNGHKSSKVDRIAYCGKVPVNVYGATPGEAIASPDFDQYKKAIGRVNRILPDGRADAAVIVH